MASTKTTTLTFRIDPALKEALEHRSLANRVEVLIRDYCGQHDITIASQSPTNSNQD